MNIGNEVNSSGQGVARRVNPGVWIAVGGFALLVVALFLLERPAEAQIDFRQLVVSILISIRQAFAGSPFFSFIVGILDALIAAFGGVVSPG